MSQGVKISRAVVLLTLVGGVAYYYSTSSTPATYGIRLGEGSEIINVDLSQAEIQEIVKQQNEVKEEKKSSSILSSNGRALRKETKNVTQKSDFVVINNKVYFKGDPLPKAKLKIPNLKPTMGRILKRLDFSRFKDEEREFMENHRQDLLKRAARVGSLCKKRPKLATSKSMNLVWDLKHEPNIVWCPNNQAASSSWMEKYLRLAHAGEDEEEKEDSDKSEGENQQPKAKRKSKSTKVFELYPPPQDQDEMESVYKDAVRVIFVKHPFEKLLSIYRHKMTKTKSKDPHLREMQLQIISQYRAVESMESSQFPTFSEFVQYVLDLTEAYQTTDDWQLNTPMFMPYWVQCNVCGADYTLILKVENKEKDERFLITLADYKELKEEGSWYDDTEDDPELGTQEFSQLNYQQIQQLHQRYLLDFQLFGYKIDQKYFDMAKDM